MKNLFLIATGQDTAGWNIRIAETLRRNSEIWRPRAMAASKTYLHYPMDMAYDKRELLYRYRTADAIHLQNQLAGWQLYDKGKGKPTILQHHGTIFREQHEVISRAARKLGVVEICSTLDLTLLEPGVEWIGVPYPLQKLREIRAANYRPHDTIRIAHAPTNRDIKGTDHFLAVCAKLATEFPVEVVLIEKQPWAQCLRLKATADIYYDQLILGYGSNAVECWAMGLPVVAGVQDPKVRSLMRGRWGALPFASASTGTLEKVLRRLIESSAARSEYAALGREHFDRWHDERVIAPILETLYSSAGRTRGGPR